MNASISEVTRVGMTAYHVTETLKLKEVDRLFEGAAHVQSATKLIFREGEDRFFFIYRFGSVVFFNVSPQRQRAVIEKLAVLIGEKPEIISEEFTLELRSGERSAIGFEVAVLDAFSLDRIELIAFVLAQSTALEYFEIKVDELFSKTGDIGHDLRSRGRLVRREGEIKRFIGQCITNKQQLVASLYLLDKPDETWEDQVLDRLYRDAVDMFEIRDRYRTVDYKLRMIQENLELISTLLQYRHANYLEWTIIVLITVEVVLFVYELLVVR